MASIFQKVRTITLGNIHALLDRAIENSIPSIEQHLRDLKEARDSLDDQAAGYRSDVSTLPKTIGGLQARAKTADQNITILLSDGDPSNDHLAAPLEAQLMQLEKDIAHHEETLANSQAEAAKFAEVVSKLDMKITDMQGRIATLRNLNDATTAKERAARALSGIQIGSTPNLDDVEARLRRNADIANNKLDRQLGRVTEAVGTSTIEADVAARLAKRRAGITPKSAT